MKYGKNIPGVGVATHPAVFILLWAFYTAALQALSGTIVLLAGVPLLVIASWVAGARLRTLFRRVSWIMLSLLLIYSYATPAVAVWAPLAEYSPTYEGIYQGVLQLSRLIFALAGLAILLGMLSQQQLISGLYVLANPLRYIGISRARLVVRLALTLQYAESAMKTPAVSWHQNIEQIMFRLVKITISSKKT